MRIRGVIDFTSNGKKEDLATKLYGSKFGGDWDIFDKLTLTLNIKLNDMTLEEALKKIELG